MFALYRSGRDTGNVRADFTLLGLQSHAHARSRIWQSGPRARRLVPPALAARLSQPTILRLRISPRLTRRASAQPTILRSNITHSLTEAHITSCYASAMTPIQSTAALSRSPWSHHPQCHKMFQQWRQMSHRCRVDVTVWNASPKLKSRNVTGCYMFWKNPPQQRPAPSFRRRAKSTGAGSGSVPFEPPH